MWAGENRTKTNCPTEDKKKKEKTEMYANRYSPESILEILCQKMKIRLLLQMKAIWGCGVKISLCKKNENLQVHG